MRNALTIFKNNIQDAKNLTSIYDYLQQTVVSPASFDDLLRFQFVHSVSAFDKLIHDLIRIGMVATFAGKRVPTPQYLSEPLTISVHNELISATTPPKEFLFEQFVSKKLKAISYQHPDKVAEGLSYIWNEKQKWQKIAQGMGMDDKTAKTTLNLIANRRNAIVHEADTNPSSNTKFVINKADCQDVTDFLKLCGEKITGLVI